MATVIYIRIRLTSENTEYIITYIQGKSQFVQGLFNTPNNNDTRRSLHSCTESNR